MPALTEPHQEELVLLSRLWSLSSTVILSTSLPRPGVDPYVSITATFHDDRRAHAHGSSAHEALLEVLGEHAVLRCRGACGRELPPDGFMRDKNRPSGRQPYCRACQREMDIVRKGRRRTPRNRPNSRKATAAAG